MAELCGGCNIQFFVMNKQSDVYSEILSLQQATRDLGARFQAALDRIRQDVLGQLSQIQEASVQEQIQSVLKHLGQLTLEHPIGLDTVSAKLDALADSVTQLQRHMKTTRSYQSVLRAVRFERLKFRHERISVAHAETFGWVFEDEAAGVHGPLSLHFRKWLRSRDGIFWIRGKAGSGKSTLMKFLCGDERTYDNLAAWATSRQRLVVAKYFFWSAGTPLQRSQEGLFRSLIYDILCQRPECIPMVQNDLFSVKRRYKTTRKFGQLISENSPDKICFFIDGLDEYDGDSENLLQTIKLFEACQRVKVCVSSRPWSEFVHEFGDDDTHLLRVKDLTAQDIRKYADETLSSNSRFKRLSAKDNSIPLLLDEIVSKSSGVFLWVRLVVQSLLQGLKYADSNQFLWKRLRSFPPDLDDFFV
ncbi:NACHT nucleoside triphosphatase, partial [Metarhizium majus ARSEF 297]